MLPQKSYWITSMSESSQCCPLLITFSHFVIFLVLCMKNNFYCILNIFDFIL